MKYSTKQIQAAEDYLVERNEGGFVESNGRHYFNPVRLLEVLDLMEDENE